MSKPSTQMASSLWKANVDDIVSVAPVLCEGTLFVATRGGNVYALDAETGSARWKDTALDSPKRAPEIHDGILLVEGDRKLLAYDTKAGKRLGDLPGKRLKSGPVSVDDRVYYIQFDDMSGQDELRFFLIETGSSTDGLRMIQPEWSVPLVSPEN